MAGFQLWLTDIKKNWCDASSEVFIVRIRNDNDCENIYFMIPFEVTLWFKWKLFSSLHVFCLPQSLNIRHNDVLTIFDGHDLMSHVIGQYLGSRERFQVVSGGSEVTIQFQSDPHDSSFILSQGFLIHYRGTYTYRTFTYRTLHTHKGHDMQNIDCPYITSHKYNMYIFLPCIQWGNMLITL